MQITDMLSQYNRNIANGTEIAGGTQGVKQIVSSLQQLSVGNVFEGNITQMENGTVTLGLPDGKTIQARLDSGVSVNVGESMFFQVKSNSGSQIAIRPFSDGVNGTVSNPTLLNALKAANLQINGKMLTMVNTMMEQSMSIDKQSLMHMARLVTANDGMDITSIVQMVKLGIPVTDELAAQFENYKADQYAILNQMETVMEELPGQLSRGNGTVDDLLEFNRQMLQVFVGEGQPSEEAAQIGEQMQPTDGSAAQTGEQMQPTDGLASQVGEQVQPEQAVQAGEQILQPGEQAAQTENKTAQSGEQAVNPAQNGEEEQITGTAAEAKTAVNGQNQEISGQSADTGLRKILSGSGLREFAQQLGKIPELAENPAVFTDGKFNENLTAKELLQWIGQAFSSKNAFSRIALGELVASKNYRSLVKNAMEQQWLLRPEDLKSENKVSELYERLDRQLEQMEKALRSFGHETRQLSDTSSAIRSNIQFMNQLNQTYTYVQLPLKMAGQNAHSDLYVYTDKRKMKDKDAELTAFLHLDMENLGSTDVSIRLKNKQVATNFYLSDDTSYQLILDHLDLLEERLKNKGYDAKVFVANQEKKPDFVENLLHQGAVSGSGMVHRYSFDVRA